MELDLSVALAQHFYSHSRFDLVTFNNFKIILVFLFCCCCHPRERQFYLVVLCVANITILLKYNNPSDST